MQMVATRSTRSTHDGTTEAGSRLVDTVGTADVTTPTGSVPLELLAVGVARAVVVGVPASTAGGFRVLAGTLVTGVDGPGRVEAGTLEGRALRGTVDGTGAATCDVDAAVCTPWTWAGGCGA
jgi:hypothetical protein